MVASFFCSFLFSQISFPSLIGVGLTVELSFKLVNEIVLRTEEEIFLLTLKQSVPALRSFRE